MNGESRGRRFLNAYNRIDEVLRSRRARKFGEEGYLAHRRLLEESPDLTDGQRRLLQKYAELRNIMTHSARDAQGQIIADPRESVVEWMERQADIIENPPLVRNVLKLQAPRVLADSDDLDSFLQLVKSPISFSQAPMRVPDGTLRLMTTNMVALSIRG